MSKVCTFMPHPDMNEVNNEKGSLVIIYLCEDRRAAD
jgi:hypothetical protein